MRIIKHIEDHAILGIKRIKTVSDILDQDVRPTSTGQILQYNDGRWTAETPYISSGIYKMPTIHTSTGVIFVGDDGEYTLYDGQNFFPNTLRKYDIPGGVFTITPEIINYIVADYNYGSPVIKNITDVLLITESNVIPILTCYNIDGDVLTLAWDHLGKGLANKLHQRFVKTRRFELEQGGCTIGEVPTRYITVTSGRVWYGGAYTTLSQQDTSTDNNDIAFYYSVNGVWSKTIVKQYNNTQYNAVGGLTNLNPNRYAVNWVFRGLSNDSTSVIVVLGTGNYTLAEAQASKVPSVPPVIKNFTVLLGRIIILNGASSATLIECTESTVFFSGVTDHNALANIQGGALDSYFHSNQSIDITDSPRFAGGYFGSVSDYSEFEGDGTLKFTGGAVVYRDIITSVINLRPGATAPTFAAFIGGIFGFRFDDGKTEEVHGSVELQHDYMEGSNLEVHLHWSPTTTNTGNCRFGFEYTIANRDSAFPVSNTVYAVSAGAGEIGRHQLVSFGEISGAGLKIGAIINFRLFRDGTNGLDTFTGNSFVHDIGIHYIVDTVGSRQMMVK